MKLDELIEYLDYKDLINFKNIDKIKAMANK